MSVVKGERLIGEIADRYAARPILVMGGAPCLPSDLERLPADYELACVISANEHGTMLRKVDLIVTVDEVHQRLGRRMQQVLRSYGVPIISQCFYADYRIPDWNFWCNSGMNAVHVAALLGGHPVIIAGIENYTGDTYFHDASAKSSGSHKKAGYFTDCFEKLASHVGTIKLRPISGPMTRRWRTFDVAEDLGPFERPPEHASIFEATTSRYHVRRSFSIGKSIVRRGEIIALTRREHAQHRDRLVTC